MDGILVVDKPAGFTSFDVVAKLRGMCGTKRIGHGGTLDPMATGVLPVFVGRAAKAVDLQPHTDKTYEAGILLGAGTDTGDVTGRLLRRSHKRVAQEALVAALPAFVGETLQTPPMVSAVKVAGRPLYEYARKGMVVERKARPVTFYEVALLRQEAADRFVVQVSCSKGGYVRVLAEEIGRALGVPACLYSLRRTRAGVFGIAEAHTLATLQTARDEGRLASLLLPVERVFLGLPAAAVGEDAAKRLSNGVAVRFNPAELAPGDGAVSRVAAGADVTGAVAAPSSGTPAAGGLCSLYFPAGFAGLGRLDAAGNLRPEKIFYPL